MAQSVTVKVYTGCKTNLLCIPLIRSSAPAIWSRIKLVPFNVQFLDGDPRQDKHLFQKLQAELPGILRWCVEGCLLWQQEGLEVPKEVIEATESYRAEQDVIAAFFNDCCVTDPQAKHRLKSYIKLIRTGARKTENTHCLSVN